MARVRWNGETFAAEPVSQNPDGSWLMKAQQHTGRTVPGTVITVQPNEIVAGTMPAAGDAAGSITAPPSDNGQAALDAAMAKERETLPSPADLIKAAQAAGSAQTSQGGPGAVPGGPTQAPAGAQASSQSKGTKPMTHLAEKARMLGTALQGLQKSTEAMLDQKLAEITAKQEAVDGLNSTFSKIDAVSSDVDDTIAAINTIAAALTNQ